MARYYEIRPGIIGYNMERCEEVVLIDAYLNVADRLQLTDSLRNEFTYYFFEKGNGISSEIIDGLNNLLSRAHLPVLQFPETTVGDYGRDIDRAWKARERHKIKAELEGLDDEKRSRFVSFALAEKARLAPPHRTWQEYREDKERQEEENRLSREAAIRDEARRRLLASATPAPPPPLPPETAAALLAATDDERLHAEIITRIPSEQIVEILRLVGDQAVKNKLVRRALGQ